MNTKPLAICAIFENEARLLPEWLAYHHLVGVDHFVLYDNGSTDASAQAVHGSPVAEHATLIRWPQRPGRVAAYRHFIDIFSPSFEWVAFIDVDQFLLPLTSHSVLDTLEWLSSASGVVVQRRVFGPGRWQAPDLAIEAYDRRADDADPANRQVRVIARGSALLDVTQTPHEFQFDGPVFNTAGHLAPNRAVQDPPCFQNLVINQYCVKPAAEGLSTLLDEPTATDAATSVDESVLAALSATEDTAIRVFAPRVRHLLRLGSAGVAGVEAPGFGPAVGEPAAAAEASPIAAMRGEAVAERDEAATQQDAATQDEAVVPVEAAVLREQDAAPAVPWLSEIAPGWAASAPDGQTRSGGLALVFRDRSRPGENWLAALRGAAANATDPAFLVDEFDRVKDFPSDAAARQACDAALAEGRRG